MTHHPSSLPAQRGAALSLSINRSQRLDTWCWIGFLETLLNRWRWWFRYCFLLFSPSSSISECLIALFITFCCQIATSTLLIHQPWDFLRPSSPFAVWSSLLKTIPARNSAPDSTGPEWGMMLTLSCQNHDYAYKNNGPQNGPQNCGFSIYFSAACTCARFALQPRELKGDLVFRRQKLRFSHRLVIPGAGA